MDKKYLVDLINEVFVPLGFKRKGNYWFCSNNELVKIINLQKSNYSRYYYLNYGYDIVGLEKNGISMHVYNRLTDVDVSKRMHIDKLLDLENDLDTNDRLSELKKAFVEKLLFEFESTNTVEELRNVLRNKPSVELNIIPLIVKNHLHLN